MMNFKYLLLIAFSTAISVNAQNNYFNEIIAHTDLKADELLVITHQNPATCVKCYIEPMDIIREIELIKSRRKLKVKFLAIVRCDREIELKVFKREVGWNYYMLVDDGNSMRKLNLQAKTIISIFNSEGKSLLNLSGGKPRENIKKVGDFFLVY